MVRYLLFFSYIGTKFNGSQRQGSYDVKTPRLSTVQDVIESGLATLRPANGLPRLVSSSRTDAGVHALCSSGHVDLRHFIVGKYYKPEVVTYGLNLFFSNENHAVRVLRTEIVPDEFHSRHQATSRTYVYRLAVVQKNLLPAFDDVALFKKYTSFVPLLETEASGLVYGPFDAEAMQRACRLFRGTHNFTSFMKTASKRDTQKPRNPVRNMKICEMKPGKGLLSEHDPFHDHLQYWDITFQSSGFLYRQVRRMVATLVALAHGKLTEDNIRFMLENPSPESWLVTMPGHIPPHGLYLKQITYNEKDLALPADYFDVITQHKCSYSDQKNFVFRRLLDLLGRRAKQLSEPSSSSSSQA